MAKPLTTIAIKAMKPDPEKRQEIPDPALSGLYLVIQPTGAKSWAVRYRFAGKPKKLTLGQWPILDLAGARAAAGAALEAVETGTDPSEARKATKQADAAPDDRNTIQRIFDKYDRDHLSRIRTGAAVKREMERHVLSLWADRDVTTITRREVRDMLEPIRDKTPIAANRVLTYVRAFFNWAKSQDYLETNVTDGIKKPARENSRERVLTDAEIKLFWAACDQIGQPWGPFGKMLLLTGQRLNEVAQMTDFEITDDNLWSLSGERTKNKRPHTVPLSNLAQDVLDGVTRIRVDGAPGYVFTSNGRTPYQGFDGARDTIHRAMSVDIPHWTFHDLRRTCATTMIRLGQQPHVVEAVLNHVSGVRSGVAGVYNRHSYDAEKSIALNAWADFILELTRHGK